MRRIPAYLVASLAITALTVSGCDGPGPDTTPPSVPVGLVASTGNGSVQLTWAQVTDGDLAGYNVYYREESGGSVEESVSSTTNSKTVTGLTNGISYLFQVTSVDEAGNESVRSNQIRRTPNSEVSLTESGWTAWEAGDYSTAESLFLGALGMNSSYPDAFTGLGWTELRQGDLTTAAGHFDQAIANLSQNMDPYVGGLIVYRELQNGLGIAMAYGLTAIQNDPDYEFSHDTTVNADLVRLMLAQVYYLNGEAYFPDAQGMMDILMPGNGLLPGDPTTWTVAGTDYSTYAAALLALIEHSFSTHGG